MNRISNLYKTLYWIGDANGQLHLLDQTRLPLHLEHTICRTAEEVWQAIKVLKVRGAPAIGGVGSVWCGDRSAGVSSRCGQQDRNLQRRGLSSLSRYPVLRGGSVEDH